MKLQVKKNSNNILQTCTVIVFALVSLFSNSQGDVWTQKSDMAGVGRRYAVSFSIGTTGYVGTGWNDVDFKLKDFWQYIPSSDTWLQKADFGGTAREGAVCFVIGTKAYVGTGEDASGYVNDFWEYNSTTDSWLQIANFPGLARRNAISFSIGNKGYVGTGMIGSGTEDVKDFWEYNPTSDSWIQLDDLPLQTASYPGLGDGIHSASAFVINNKGYVGTGLVASTVGGVVASKSNDVFEFDPSTNMWVQKADLEGFLTNRAVSFTFGNKGYFGTGVGTNSIWEYNSIGDSWLQKSDFGGILRWGAWSLSVDNRVFIGGGNNAFRDVWEYSSISGVNEINDSNIEVNISPNPSNGVFKISPEKGINTQLNIYIKNNIGQVVYSESKFVSGKDYTINTELTAGVYFVQIENENFNTVEKIVIQ